MPLRLAPRCLRMSAIADWISATTLMLRNSRSARRRFLRTGVYSGSPRFTLKSTLERRCCMLVTLRRIRRRRSIPDTFHIVGIGLNAETRGWIAGAAWRRRNLVGFNEPNAGYAIAHRQRTAEMPRRRDRGGGQFPVAAVASDFPDEIVEQPLDLHRDFVRRVHAFADRRPVAMAGPDNVGDAIFVTVDGELVCRG